MALVRAITTFHLPGPAVINAGDIVDDSDPVVRKHPAFFESVGAAASRSAEVLEATARPGAKRGAKP